MWSSWTQALMRRLGFSLLGRAPAYESHLVINTACADHNLVIRLHQLGVGEKSSAPGVESCTRGLSCRSGGEAYGCLPSLQPISAHDCAQPYATASRKLLVDDVFIKCPSTELIIPKEQREFYIALFMKSHSNMSV